MSHTLIVKVVNPSTGVMCQVIDNGDYWITAIDENGKKVIWDKRECILKYNFNYKD